MNLKVQKMKKSMLVLILCLICGGVFSGQVGVPIERLEFPIVEGEHWVCVWDEAAGNWYTDFEIYDHSRSYRLQVPAWGKWYWIGLWNATTGEYVYEKWIGHFPTD
jgi:hypothetical protein